MTQQRIHQKSAIALAVSSILAGASVPAQAQDAPSTTALGEVFVTASRDPCHLRREPCDVVLLLQQQAFGDQQREVGVDVPGRLDADVELALQMLPHRIAVRPDDHEALDRGVVGEFGLADDVEVPLRKIDGLLGDLGNERFFLFAGH